MGLSIFFFNILKRNRKKRSLATAGTREEEDDDRLLSGFDFGRLIGEGDWAKEIHPSAATNNFPEAGKLGEGGFGGVYRGFSRDLNMDVAVKRVFGTSKQGRKEFASEVRNISRLRHRNLVQLMGWCHPREKFLLVYEFLPNGNLDARLFCDKNILPWETRYKIATGLASPCCTCMKNGSNAWFTETPNPAT